MAAADFNALCRIVNGGYIGNVLQTYDPKVALRVDIPRANVPVPRLAERQIEFELPHP